jgi:ribose transport system permease protein
MSASGFDATRPILLLVLLALALGGFAAGHPSILSSGNLNSMAVFAVEIGMIAFGQTLVICGGDGGIDLSVGAIAALSQVVLGRLIAGHIPWPAALALTLGGGLILGLINAVAINWFRIPPIIATLATLFGYNGLALVATGGVNIDLTHAPSLFLAIGQGHVAGLPFQLLCLYLPLLALFIYAQHFSRYGRSLYLAGSNEMAGRLAGLRVARLRGAAYIASGLVSSLAGIIGAARLGTARPDASSHANLISIAIVVLGGTGIMGGTGSVIGTALATAVIAVIDYGLSYNNFNPIYQAGMIGSILIILMLIENLFGLGRRYRV